MESMLIKFAVVMKLRGSARMEARMKFKMILTNWRSDHKWVSKKRFESGRGKWDEDFINVSMLD